MNRPDPEDYQKHPEYVQALEEYCDYLERLIFLKTIESKIFMQPT